MNVLELTALLEDADPDAEVLIVSQPSWLLRFTVAGVYDASDHAQPCDPHGRLRVLRVRLAARGPERLRRHG